MTLPLRPPGESARSSPAIGGAFFYASLVQLAGHDLSKIGDAGSSPAGRSNFWIRMLPSVNAIRLVKASEGVRLTAYTDAVGVLTIGYGHTGGVRPGQTITQAQADNFLFDDLGEAASAVDRLVTVPLTQNQFDALVDFVFNEGQGNFARSTLLKLLNQKNYQAAAAQFPVWCMADGQVLPGLVTRRAAERALFEAL